MKTELVKQGEILIARFLDNRLDSEVAADFRDCMLEHIRKGEHNIVLNICSVDFIDSSGLGAIVASKKAMGADGHMAITGTQRAVMTMFKLTRMDRVFQMFDSDAEAVRVLSKQGTGS